MMEFMEAESLCGGVVMGMWSEEISQALIPRFEHLMSDL